MNSKIPSFRRKVISLRLTQQAIKQLDLLAAEINRSKYIEKVILNLYRESMAQNTINEMNKNEEK